MTAKVLIIPPTHVLQSIDESINQPTIDQSSSWCCVEALGSRLPPLHLSRFLRASSQNEARARPEPQAFVLLQFWGMGKQGRGVSTV